MKSSPTAKEPLRPAIETWEMVTKLMFAELPLLADTVEKVLVIDGRS
jgi:hypothetical protein